LLAVTIVRNFWKQPANAHLMLSVCEQPCSIADAVNRYWLHQSGRILCCTFSTTSGAHCCVM
jgi:hypothetical protein